METHVDCNALRKIFDKAHAEGRDFLYEYEVYDLIRGAGSETPPAYYVLPRTSRLSKEQIEEFPGDRVVIKILSPLVLHKSDVGGVAIVTKSVEHMLSAVRRMYYEVPARYAEAVRRGKFEPPRALINLDETSLQERVAQSIKGVVICQYMHPDSHEFGNELLVSLRLTREFGMIVSAGLGGTDTELYARRFRKGQAVVAASTEMVSGDEFFTLFQNTISYRKLAGLTRGQQRIVTDEQLLECFSAMIEVGRYFSPLNEDAPYVIEELEINPFAFSNYLMLPLDGLCRFGAAATVEKRRPAGKIERLLHPRSIAVVGASSRGKNIGRIILENIKAMGFGDNDGKHLHVVHPSGAPIAGIDCVNGIDALPEKVDLLLLAVKGEAIAGLLERVIAHDLAESVVLIPGSMGESGEQDDTPAKLQKTLDISRKKGISVPVLLGGNSLGVLSHPGGYDGVFIPESKLPRKKGNHLRKTALVSQSGAYMITRMSKLAFLDPAYAVSIGNQVDLTAGDFLAYLQDCEGLESIAFYIEGFADFDGLRFSQAVRRARAGKKEVIFYKAGRTAEGKTALSGHTASIAGDYMVCESCISQAGAFVAETFSEFEGLLCLSRALHGKTIRGDRLAAISNAGYEAVGIADNILGEDYALRMASYSSNSVAALHRCLENAGLAQLAHVANPMDVTPMASEEVYSGVIDILLGDDAVDAIIVAIVPLTPILHTLPDEHIADAGFPQGSDIVERIASLDGHSTKPMVMVVDSGPLYDHLAAGFEQAGLAVFRSADQAVRLLGKYVRKRLELLKP